MNITKFHFLSSASILIIHCFMVSYAMTVRNLTTDQYALLQFKQQISDPQNILANNWTTITSVCNWVGVSCAVKHRRVRALSLPNMNFTGTIPPHLGNLSFLDFLNLSLNHFEGHLPTELGQLNRLKFIDLSHNFFTGEIPSSINECKNLQSLTLDYNKFSGSISRSIGNISRLKMLYLSYNDFEGFFFFFPSIIFFSKCYSHVHDNR